MHIITEAAIPDTGNWYWATFQEQMRKLGIERRLVSELRNGALMRHAKARRIAAAERELIDMAGGARPIEGAGQMMFNIPGFLMNVFRLRFGPHFLQDPKAKAIIRREYPECVVPYRKKARVTR